MRISAMASISENRVLGKNNDLVFRIPEDFVRMKKITSGHPIIMGRKTFESIGRPLPNRLNIVITHDPSYQQEGVVVTHSLTEALRKAEESLSTNCQLSATAEGEVFIFGGGQIFTEALPITDRLYLTLVHKEVEGDTFFPDYSEFTKVIEKEEHLDAPIPYTFLTVEKP